ncbi:hypothetical protein JJV70_09185 [Streptomyces sp. JJ66]|uniref:hypothetical protein n=1 Tax=Streptomyces sp. JJ66 TaxID=2803843 RepID=UPI001C5A25EF|nr:hypothetical protein [Streptomyces sp. JJ66]MBW1602280.1 hypothetical protein [Streptomyces sp. JJ66]
MRNAVAGFWCEAVARCPATGDRPGGCDAWFLGGYRASSPRLAVRWLRGQALRLARALDPRPGTGPLPAACLHRTGPNSPNPGHILRTWAQDLRCQETHLLLLAAARPINITAGGPDSIYGLRDTDVYYSLTARPLPVEASTSRKIPSPRSAPP